MAEEKKPEVKKEKFKLAKEFKAFISKGHIGNPGKIRGFRRRRRHGS